MYRSSANRLSATLVSVVACLFLLSSSSLPGAEKQKAGDAARTPKVKHSIKHDRSGPLRDVTAATKPPSGPNRAAARNEGPRLRRPGIPGVDPVVQRAFGSTDAPDPMLNFDGTTAADNEPFFGFTLAPPDTEGDVGGGFFFQFVNSVFSIWETDGTLVIGPLPGTALFEGFGGLCENNEVTDPIVRYDDLAGRWLATYLAFDINVQDTFDMCIAVSTTGDPTQSYNRYSYNFGNVPDYPKFGVWPDGYYMTVNQFNLPFFDFAGIATWVFDRTAMLAGDPAVAIGFTDLGTNMFSMLPADLDGSLAPAEGAPNPQVTLGHPVWDGNPDPVLHFFQFHADFETPGDSTLTGPIDVPIPDLNPDLCGFSRDCIPQLDSGDGLDPLPGRPMHGMQYRNMGTHESLVISQTVNVAGAPIGEGGLGNQAGVRWYEVRTPDTPTLHQSGTFAPDSTNRFMPSIAMDINGNIAVGYSVSDATIYPEIRLTGRLATDPLGEMGAEATMFAGTGSQIATFNRWGDYSSMSVDPADGCTFWYTNQYYEETSEFNWKTRIGSFKFASCTIGPSGTIEGTVTDGTNPLEDATVTAGLASTTTDAAGHYELTLPIGTYDMTASKYGYLPGAAEDVEVLEDTTTTQDFTLATAPSQLVNGTVRDLLGNWPLYARIQVSGPGYPGSTHWTNPVTGYYSVTLAEGITYTFLITAVSPGYEPGGGDVPLGVPLNAPFLVQNWTLEANLETCNAPGYSPSTTGLFEDFSGGSVPPGWEVTNDSTGGTPGFPTEWVIEDGGEPCFNYPGNLTGGTGFFAVSDSDCPGSSVVMDTSLITPSVDLSALSSASVQFNQDYLSLGDDTDVDVSINGGSSWTNVLHQDTDQRGPRLTTIDITGLAAGESDVKVRFHNYNAAWAWWWQVDNILVGQGDCSVGTGGLAVGTVVDGGTGTGLNGATVTNIGGGSTTTFATPDPAQPDGFYILYAEAGPQDFEASFPGYQPDEGSLTVVPGTTLPLFFELLAGNLTVTPTALNGRVNPGGTEEQELEITNIGAAEATFDILEINAPLLESITAGFASEASRQAALARMPKGKSTVGQMNTKGLAALPENPAQPGRTLGGGNVLASYFLDLIGPWGVAYNLAADDFWASDFEYFGGNNYSYRYTPDGTATGDIIDNTSWAGPFDLIADGTYNLRTGMLWNVLAGGDQCIYELDPVAKVPTGNTICPDWGGLAFGERGLAYDVATDTFYSGSWEDSVINHFDLDGNIIDSASVGLAISGLAFFPNSGHLHVMINGPTEPITVLDAHNNYEVVGSFDISEGFGNFAGAGLESDCDGNLWVINQNDGKIYKVASGEVGSPCELDIPWFSVDPETGTVGPAPLGEGAANPFPVAAQWDAGSLLPGLQLAQLVVNTNTPYQIPNIPVSLTVRFLDVPDANQFEAYIYAAAGAGVMFGGPPVCPPGVLYFCPDGNVTRADMAGYLWRAINGRNTPPPVYQNVFTDVTFNDYNSFYIQGVYDMGIAAGCGTAIYCPNVPVTRAQMSALVWRGEHGDEPPPACTGVFADVPCPSLFADYIEGLAAEGIVVGCGGGNFCPHQPITNGQMSVFLVNAFGIPVLLP